MAHRRNLKHTSSCNNHRYHISIPCTNCLVSSISLIFGIHQLPLMINIEVVMAEQAHGVADLASMHQLAVQQDYIVLESVEICLAIWSSSDGTTALHSFLLEYDGAPWHRPWLSCTSRKYFWSRSAYLQQAGPSARADVMESKVEGRFNKSFHMRVHWFEDCFGFNSAVSGMWAFIFWYRILVNVCTITTHQKSSNQLQQDWNSALETFSQSADAGWLLATNCMWCFVEFVQIAITHWECPTSSKIKTSAINWRPQARDCKILAHRL